MLFGLVLIFGIFHVVGVVQVISTVYVFSVVNVVGVVQLEGVIEGYDYIYFCCCTDVIDVGHVDGIVFIFDFNQAWFLYLV